MFDPGKILAENLTGNKTSENEQSRSKSVFHFVTGNGIEPSSPFRATGF
jgi:hypothetical protein